MRVDPENCPHPDNLVSADICEGDARWAHDGSEYAVQWCRVCGSYRMNDNQEWRTPFEELPPDETGPGGPTFDKLSKELAQSMGFEPKG